MRITVSGAGYVGLSSAMLLSQSNEVIINDINPEKVEMLNNGISPIDDNEISPMSKTYTKAYLHHLFKTEEILGYRITTQHNLRFYIHLMNTMQEEIKAGNFKNWAKGFLERYGGE